MEFDRFRRDREVTAGRPLATPGSEIEEGCP